MDGPTTVSELLSLLGSGITPHDLAESMSNPLWYLAKLPIETDIAIAIGSVRALRDRARKEIQHALLDEFIDPPDSSDAERQEFILEQMRQFIPPQANADILAKVIYVYAHGTEEDIAEPDLTNESNTPVLAGETATPRGQSTSEAKDQNQASEEPIVAVDGDDDVSLEAATVDDSSGTSGKSTYRRHRRL